MPVLLRRAVTPQLQAALLLNLASLLWAGNMLLGRLLSEYVGPWFIVGARALVGSLILAMMMLLQRRRAPGLFARVPNWPLLIAMALAGIIGFPILLYEGLRYTSAINAGLINAFTPFATALLALVLLRAPLSRRQALAAAITILGVGWIVAQGQWAVIVDLRVNRGDLLILAAVFLWSLYGILGRRVLHRLSVVEVTALGLFIAALIAVPLAVWEAQTRIPPRLDLFVIGALAFICVGPTVLALLCWNRAVALVGPALAALHANMIPVYAIAIAVLGFGERLTTADMIGAGLVLGGSVYGGLGSVRQRR